MSFELITEIFKIDKLKNKWPVRLLFLLMVLMNSSIRFLPEEYSDFSAVYEWLELFYSSTYEERMQMYMAELPMTAENALFVLLAFVIIFLNVMGIMLYAGIFIRQYRSSFKQLGKEKKFLKPISVSGLVGRYILLFLWMTVIALPIYFVCIYLFVIVIFVVPYLMVIPVGYLSGDFGFFETVGKSIKYMKGHYLTTSRFLSIIIIAYFIVSFVVSGVYLFAPTAFYILDSFVLVWILFSVGRLSVVAYTDMVVKP